MSILRYFEWWNLNFAAKLPDHTHALLGIPYEVDNPRIFHELLIKNNLLDESGQPP